MTPGFVVVESAVDLADKNFVAETTDRSYLVVWVAATEKAAESVADNFVVGADSFAGGTADYLVEGATVVVDHFAAEATVNYPAVVDKDLSKAAAVAVEVAADSVDSSVADKNSVDETTDWSYLAVWVAPKRPTEIAGFVVDNFVVGVDSFAAVGIAV